MQYRVGQPVIVNRPPVTDLLCRVVSVNKIKGKRETLYTVREKVCGRVPMTLGPIREKDMREAA